VSNATCTRLSDGDAALTSRVSLQFWQSEELVYQLLVTARHFQSFWRWLAASAAEYGVEVQFPVPASSTGSCIRKEIEERLERICLRNSWSGNQVEIRRRRLPRLWWEAKRYVCVVTTSCVATGKGQCQ
jgi:hypothetical protein